jgi:hypothetical protein
MAKQTDLHKEQALEYHAGGRPGKIEVVPIAPEEQNPAKKLLLIAKMFINIPLKET